MIDSMKNNSKMCQLRPIGSTRVPRQMSRTYTIEWYRDRIELLKAIPDLAVNRYHYWIW